jgi:hypothetical protein
MPAFAPQLTLHYGGTAGGPAVSFGIEIDDFAAESEHLFMADPALAYARSAVLHYFAACNRSVSPARFIFRFHESDLVRFPPCFARLMRASGSQFPSCVVHGVIRL